MDRQATRPGGMSSKASKKKNECPQRRAIRNVKLGQVVDAQNCSTGTSNNLQKTFLVKTGLQKNISPMMILII